MAASLLQKRRREGRHVAQHFEMEGSLAGAARGQGPLLASGATLRVAHILAGLGFGGAERLALALREQADGAGWRTVVEGAPATQPGLASAGLASAGGRAFGGESTELGWALAARKRVRDVDLVHVHLSSPSMLGYGALVAGSKPRLFTFHLLPRQRWPRDRCFRLPSKWLLQGYGRSGSRLLFNSVSHADYDKLTATLSRNRLRAIRNAPPEQSSSPWTGPGPWTPGMYRAIAVGRLESQKGFERLIRCFASPELRALPVQLVVVGDGPDRPQLEMLIQTLGLRDRVLLVGAAPGVPLLQVADLAVSTSFYEGMPLVPMEAVQAGTPVLLSPIAPHIELFGEFSGSLLPESEQAWPAEIAAMVRDRAASKALTQTQASLLHSFSMSRLWGDYETLYRELL